MLDIMEKFLYNAQIDATSSMNGLGLSILSCMHSSINGLGAKYDPKNRTIESKII